MRRSAWVLLALLVLAAPAFATTPNTLAVTHRGGQSFITFTEAGCGGGSYKVWRETSQITTVSGKTEIATLDQDSGRLLYNDDPGTITAGQNLTTGFIVTDNGSHLASSKGLLVWTTALSGDFYYAVTSTCDTAISVGTNSLSGPVSETSQAVPGAVLLNVTTGYGGGSYTKYKYFMWEDYSTWKHTQWGYYGHRFDVDVPEAALAPEIPYPLTLQMHSAGGADGYAEPLGYSSGTVLGAVVTVRDFIFSGTDPYVGGGYGYAKTGRYDSGSGLYLTAALDGIIARAVKLVRDSATGDGHNFNIDSNRVYAIGSSLGSNAMHVISHHTDMFAAGEVSVGMVNDNAFAQTCTSGCGGGSNTTVHVDTGGGPTIAQYRDLAYQASIRALPPIVHSPNQDDGTVNPAAYPAAVAAFETYHQPYAIQWKLGNHAEFTIRGDYPQWDFRRFKKNEAYPAFSSAANSNTPEAVHPWAGGCAAGVGCDANGQKNGLVDWDNSLHNLGGGTAGDIQDTTYRFRMAFKSTSGSDTTATVTLRNVQNYLPPVGTSIAWSNDNGYDGAGAQIASGTVTVASDHTITLTSVSIKAAGNRLTFSPISAAWADFSGLPICSDYGATKVALGATWTITAPTTTVPASSNNFKTLANGVWSGSRAFTYIKQGASLYIVGFNGRFYQLTDTVGGYAGPLGLDVVGCRLPASADNSLALQSNAILVDNLGGVFLVACDEDPMIPSDYGDYCPDFPGATIDESTVIRNGDHFPVLQPRAVLEPNNTPFSIKWCGNEMYRKDYETSGATYSKWAGIGVGAWVDATGTACVTGGASRRQRQRSRLP